jgi:DNA-binding IclR family transcriptional regulator
MAGPIQRGVASVEIAGAILHGLKGSPAPMSLQQLSALCGLTRSRLHHYLVSLVRVGLVRKDRDGYALGSFALELGLVAADNLDLQHASASWLRKLSAETGESSFFSVGSPRGALIVRWEQGSRPLTVHARLGTVMPILTSATGLTWLAFDRENSAGNFEAELRRIDPPRRKGVCDARLADAGTALEAGIAVARGSMIGNVNALACPVISRTGRFAGILTILGLGSYFDGEPNGITAKKLRAHAKSFGQGLP